MKIDQTNSGIRSIVIPGDRILIMVVMKFIDAIIDEAPARWREKIARSTHPPAWAAGPDNGGYTVHPVPTPLSLAAEVTRRKKEGGTNQKLIFFIRGKAMSGAPIMRGTNQLPNPPIIIGITMKKIITKAWAVTITLYSWSSWRRDPGWESSTRIMLLMAVPTVPAHAPNKRYKVPMSLWLVENSHRWR